MEPTHIGGKAMHGPFGVHALLLFYGSARNDLDPKLSKLFLADPSVVLMSAGQLLPVLGSFRISA